MSEENVEIIRAVVAAFNRGDWDAALSTRPPTSGSTTLAT